MGSLLDRLKPTDREIRELALRETNPRLVARFEPIARGRLLALVAIPVVVLLALPSCLLRLARGAFRRDAEAR